MGAAGGGERCLSGRGRWSLRGLWGLWGSIHREVSCVSQGSVTGKPHGYFGDVRLTGGISDIYLGRSFKDLSDPKNI